ncbi:MAG: hypothetical protein AAF703_03175 [Cyanobacteria bacterium P01_D01_bin.105]
MKSLIVDKFLSVWWVVVVLMLLLPFVVWFLSFTTAPKSSNTCRVFSGHQVCAVSIKRSAARYWEYRTVLNVDGIKQPLEIYNCRDRIRTLASDGSIVPFLTGKTGDWICQLTTPSKPSRLTERVDINIR